MFISKVIPRLAENHSSVTYFGYSSLTKEWSSRPNLKSFNLLQSNIQKNLTKFKTGILYFALFFKSLKYLKDAEVSTGVVISHSDAWPDALFAFLFKLKNRNVKWVAINHFILPNPLKGYENVYTKRIKIPSLVDLYQWFNQRLFFILQKKADLLVSINSNDRKYLLKKNKNVLIVKHGREYARKIELDFSNKVYDICFLGRFFKQKGIDEIPDIFSNLRKIYRGKLNILFIGEQNNYARWLDGKLVSLEYNINFAGFKYGDEKYQLLKKSKVLIFPSYFESFGIVYLDAISVGVPVVEYDLPCFADHKYGVIKVPFKDNYAFAQNLRSLLTNENLYKKLCFEGYHYSQEFSWDKTAKSLDQYIMAWCA
ncbi:MAG: glycosyltransferase family 4 protein [Candidatus Omnitrophica bacterium]|nr:glycosyltransferase family 4 protein [Candidatus Omnitrophota bacterium]